MSMRHIYRKIAREHGVTIGEVKRDMQAAIQDAYHNNNKSYDEIDLQESILRKNKIPTAEELIRYVSMQVRKNGI
ncbi:MAG: sporulation initiation factor Spo0A [Epulopiscium sp.]|jgi:hypothetical protein|nr:sporulation initiation factor Spo0A [Candidatus Epulonipiscium sp.]